MIEAVAFDLEGTVIDVEDKHFEAMRLAAKEIGVVFDPNNLVADIASKIQNAIGGGDAVNSRGIWELSDKNVPIEQISSRKFYFYNQLVQELVSIDPRPGFLGVLRQIRNLGLPIAIASLTVRHQAEILLKRSGVEKLFSQEHILLRDSVEHAKPAPDVYLKAAELMGVHPSEVLVFEDSPTGITAAKAAECTAIAMPVFWHRQNVVDVLEAGASRIFCDWREINIEALIENLDNKVVLAI